MIMTAKEFEIQLALGTLSLGMKYRLIDNSNTPVEVLTKLSTDEDSNIRYWVARNPNTPVEILITLSTDEDSSVRHWVASNPSTPVEVLVKLSTDKDSYVQFGIKLRRRILKGRVF